MMKELVLIYKEKRGMTDGMRFRILAVFLVCVYLIQAGIFAVMRCLPLVAVNLFFSLLNLAGAYRSRNCQCCLGWISMVYFAACFQSLLSCVLLGWTYGFSLYNIVMIPVVFYMLYLTEHIDNPKKYALIYTVANCVATLVLRRIVYGGKPVYYYPVGTDFKISFFNNIVCFLFVIVFSTLFILELAVSRKELMEQNKKLVRLANYDELTQLRNRRSILAEWKHMQRTDYCVIMGDIDDFKKINDTYGHEQGDEVLKTVAASMADAVNEEDYVSRWGGEEFLLIVFGDLAYTLTVVECIRQKLKQAELQSEEHKIVVTMTFGVSQRSSVPDGDIDELIRQADRRLYLGKRAGKNCVKVRDE